MCVCMYLQCAQLTRRPRDAAQTSPESGGHAGHVGQPTGTPSSLSGKPEAQPGLQPRPPSLWGWTPGGGRGAFPVGETQRRRLRFQ